MKTEANYTSIKKQREFDREGDRRKMGIDKPYFAAVSVIFYKGI